MKTNWKPDPCGKECAKAFNKFEPLVNEPRRNLPTYRRYNLRKFERKALKELRNNKNIIIHDSDKQLGTFVAPRNKYIKQCLKEHMLNPQNYVRLLPEEAKKELEEQKRLLREAYEECSDLTSYHIQYFDRSFQKIESEGN